MTRLLHPLTLAALTLLAVLAIEARLAAVLADDVADCINGKGDVQLRGCSRIIKSGKMDGLPISKENLASVHYNRGNGYYNRREYDRAIADYKQAIKLNPTDVEASYNLGLAYEKVGNLGEAIISYNKILQLNPGNELATKRLKSLTDSPPKARAAPAEESEQRVFRASDGSTLKLQEDSRMEYESWSGGHMCVLSGELRNTPKTRATQELLFVHDQNPDCKGALRYLDPLANSLSFYTNGNCRAACGARNPPPTKPLRFNATR